MKLGVWLGCLGVAMGGAGVSAKTTPVDLGEMSIATPGEEVQDKSAPTSHYESYDPVDSGKSVISSKTVDAGREGGSDTTALLESLPFVQMDTQRQAVTNEDVQSIRPSDFSISGGNYYDNNIMIDGVSATSIMDVSSQSREDYNEVYGQTSQSLYVDPSLIGSVEVLDSNVSSRYGNFTGGAVNFKLREPARKFGVHYSAGFQNDSMVKYRKEEKYATSNRSAPDFTKYQTSLSVDLPLTEKLSTLVAITRSESDVNYQMDEAYGGLQYKSGDTSSNYLLKARYEYQPELTFTGQLIYSPYRSEKQPDNSINSLNVNHSDGLSSYLAVNGISGASHWQHKVSYQVSDASRDWDGDRYSWPSKASSVTWCSSANCTSGGFGDLDQSQQDSAYEFSLDFPLAGGDMTLGSELRYTQVSKQRTQDNYYYSSGKLMSSKATAKCDSLDTACQNDVVLSQYAYYKAYDADIDLFNQAVWVEYLRQVGDWELRAGSRLSHDDFLGNYNVAPRMTATWEFIPSTYLTLGANRYYAANMVGYAIRSQYPDSYTYRRTVNTNTGAIGDWSLYSHGRSTDYGEAGLDTPYSDELTTALTFPAPLDGTFRIKGVLRQYRDSFASTDKESVAFNTDTGKTTSTTLYSMTNDGKSDYKGLALEWSGHYLLHSFNANVTWSKTKTYGNATSYFDYTDPGDDIYFNGQIISMDELYDLDSRSNFAAPLRAAIGWTARWPFDLTTTTSIKYRGSYEYLGDGDDNIIIDSVQYPVYEKIKLDAFTSVDLNTRYQLFQYLNQSASVDVRVTNLFDAFPHTETTSSNPYQQGRSFWLGFNYIY